MDKFRRYIITAEFHRFLMKNTQEDSKEYSKGELLAIAKKICKQYGVPTPPIVKGDPGPKRDGLYTAKSSGGKTAFNIILRRWDMHLLLHELSHHLAFMLNQMYTGHGNKWQYYYAELIEQQLRLAAPAAKEWAKKEADYQPKMRGETNAV